MMNRRAILAGSLGVTALAAGPAGAEAAGKPRVYSAADFGVVPDLPQDQSKALQAAIDSADSHGGYLILPPGTYVARGLTITAPTCLQGMPGLTRLVLSGDGPLLTIVETGSVTLSGLILDGNNRAVGEGLVVAQGAKDLTVEQCVFRSATGNGLSLSGCSGWITRNTLHGMSDAAIFSIDSSGLEITQNHVHDCADNGILVWQSEIRDDGSLVSHNRIERIGNRSGGSGQWGNGINVFRAGRVSVLHNQISDCAYTAIRNNAGHNVQIVGNSCARMWEVAIYSEFGFEGAVISDNIVDGAETGISITNFNDGGRLAVCANNLIRNLKRRDLDISRTVGIGAEADAVVSGNVIENVPDEGIALGWGPYARNLSATGNMVRNCGTGIVASVTDKAGKALIANNVISGAKHGAIFGMDHLQRMTADLTNSDSKMPATLSVTGNLVS